MASYSNWASMSPSPQFRSTWCPGNIDHCRLGRLSFAIMRRGLHRSYMTKLLEQAIAKVRELPPEDQDTFAAAILSMAGEDSPVVALDDETRTAIREGLTQGRRGEFVPDEEITALWKRHGL